MASKVEDSPDGYSNGHAVGTSSTETDGPYGKSPSAIRPSQRAEPAPIVDVLERPKPRPTVLGALVSITSRLAIWYAIIVVLFRCPSDPSLLDDSSPRMCKPYFSARDIVTPYTAPYYNRYASPYLEALKPHYDRAIEQVVVPAANYGKATYDKYGRQQVDFATAYGQKQWDTNVKPQIDLTTKQAKDQYQQNLAPHVDTLVKTSSPYVDHAKKSAIANYATYIVPAYLATLPYAQQGYAAAYAIAVQQVLPHVKLVWNVVSDWVGRNAMPRLIILYGDNIEPQLIRIGERLGRYGDRKKLQSIVASAEASAKTAAAESFTPPQATQSSRAQEHARLNVKSEAENFESRAKELSQWQTTFSAAFDSGKADLEKRIADILDKEGANTKKVGGALLIQLEETAASQLTNLKANIKALAAQADEDVDVERFTQENLQPLIKNAATTVKEKSVAIRQWSQQSVLHSQELIDEATSSTLEILDGIRDLGLQDIGLRWSKITGVAHSEWAKYQEAKKTASKWRSQVEEQTKSANVGDATSEISDRASKVTEDTAKELGRLRAVGQWKIVAKDSSDDFSDRVLPAKVAKVASQASEVILGESETPVPVGQSVFSDASEKIENVASAVSGKLEDASGVIRSATDAGSSSASSVMEAPAASVSSAASAISSHASSLTESIASAAVAVGGSTDLTETVDAEKTFFEIPKPSQITEEPENPRIQVSVGSAPPRPPPLHSTVIDVFEESSSSLLSGLSKASESATADPRVAFGASAQKVSSITIVYDDKVVEVENSIMSEKIDDAVSAVGDTWNQATRAVYQAILAPTDARGSPIATLSSIASEKYASAMSAASVAIYGTQKGTGEVVASAASSRYNDAVYAASVAIYGTPTPIAESVASQVSAAGSVVTDSALQQYAALSAMFSELVSGREPDFTESVMNRFSSVYYAGPFATAAASASSVASEAYASAESVASGAYAGVSSVVDAVSSAGGSAYSNIPAADEAISGVSSAAASVYSNIPSADEAVSSVSSAAASVYSNIPSASDIVDGVNSNVEAIVGAASEQVFGTPKGTYELAQESAASVYNAAQARASQAVYGTVKGSYEQMTASAASAYSAALSSASIALYGTQKSQVQQARESAASVYSDILSRASEGVYGTKQNSIDAATSSANSVYSSVLAQASIAIYGTKGSQMEAAKESASSMYAEALAKASEGIYGTQTGLVEQAKASVVSAYDAAVEAASVAIYGTTKGPLEYASDSAGSAFAQATENAGGVYSAALRAAEEAASSASSLAAQAATGAAGVASGAASSISSAASEGSRAASEAVYGSSTGTVESVVSQIKEKVAEATQMVADSVSSAVNKGKDEL